MSFEDPLLFGSQKSNGSTTSSKKRSRSENPEKSRHKKLKKFDSNEASPEVEPEKPRHKKHKTFDVNEACHIAMESQPDAIQLKMRIIKPVLQIRVSNRYPDQVEWTVRLAVYDPHGRELAGDSLKDDTVTQSVEFNESGYVEDVWTYGRLKTTLGLKSGPCHIGFNLYVRPKGGSDTDWQLATQSPVLTQPMTFYTHTKYTKDKIEKNKI